MKAEFILYFSCFRLHQEVKIQCQQIPKTESKIVRELCVFGIYSLAFFIKDIPSYKSSLKEIVNLYFLSLRFPSTKELFTDGYIFFQLVSEQTWDSR